MSQKWLRPNTTQVPNRLFDRIFPLLNEYELKCLLYIIRRTYGFQKENDSISLTQFTDGIKNREGRIIDIGSGLGRKTVTRALKRLIESTLVTKKIGTVVGISTNTYSLNITGSIDTIVEKLGGSVPEKLVIDRSDSSVPTTLPSRGNTSVRGTPLVVSGGHPQNKELETKKKQRPPLTPQGVPSDPDFILFWQAYPRKVRRVVAVRAWMRIRPSPEVVKSILEALEAHKSSDQWTRDGGKFIPHPATWLNQEAWTDELESSDNLEPILPSYARKY